MCIICLRCVVMAAATERDRWTNCICPQCGGWMRLTGAIRNNEVMCMNKCHNTLYLKEWFVKEKED